MLILYTADDCRLLTETLFAGIILFVRCDGHSILEEIKKFANSALKYSCSLKKIFAQCKIFLEGTLLIPFLFIVLLQRATALTTAFKLLHQMLLKKALIIHSREHLPTIAISQ